MKDKKKVLKSSSISTPLGDMTAIADDDYLYLLGFCNTAKMSKTILRIQEETKSDIIEGSTKLHNQLETQLDEYFHGKLKTFTIPIKLIGTDFQKEVWKHISQLEFGTTKSYGELAIMCGKDTRHSRSIGNATGANPIVIIVPCHRVKAHNNKLGGFSCGIERKIWLLKHENSY